MTTLGPLLRQGALLTVVELRKIVFTRVSQVILCCTMALGLLISAALTVFAGRETGLVDLSAPVLSLSLAVAIGTPLIGVLIMTSDWQSREITTLFVLEPRRGVVFATKVTATLALSVLTVAAVVLVSLTFALCTVLLTGMPLVHDTAVRDIAPLFIVCVVGAFSGAALASAILSTPLAIVAVGAQTLVIDPVLSLVPHGAGAYFSSSSMVDYLTGATELAPALTSFALWVLLPFLIGWWRIHRREA